MLLCAMEALLQLKYLCLVSLKSLALLQYLEEGETERDSEPGSRRWLGNEKGNYQKFATLEVDSCIEMKDGNTMKMLKLAFIDAQQAN